MRENESGCLTNAYTHTYSVIVLTVGLTSNWPTTVNMRDSPTGVHTDDKRQEAALNAHTCSFMLF